MAKWWTDKPRRLIQTNLREIDVDMDIEKFIKSIKDYSADTLLLNVGGIVANYETELDYHYRNPYMINNFAEEVINLAHKNDIYVIARFDFSRLNEQIAEQHPDWLYKSVGGKTVNYNGQVHTSFNGLYQQECSIKIMTEAAKKLPIDGVFINMHGYVTHDYSYNYIGICQSESDRIRFQQMYGHEQLPVAEDPNDSLFRDYVKFRSDTIKDLFLRRSQAVKAINENIAICNYTPEGTDIFRLESNTGIDRALPEFNYSASHHVKLVRNTWPGMAVSNSAVHFVDFAMRHTAVSPHLTASRLAQDLIHGGWLDYYVIGTLLNQEDRLCAQLVQGIFRYHQENEQTYTNLESVADICLIQPSTGAHYMSSGQEFRGVYRMLSEQHFIFDVVHDDVLESLNASARLSRYRTIILPNAENLSKEACAAIDAFVHAGGKLLATGATSTRDYKGTPMNEYQLSSLGGGKIKQSFPQQQGTYFAITEKDKTVLKGFEALDLVYLYGEYTQVEPKQGSSSMLNYVPPCMFGPPEKCYYTEVSDEPGLLRYSYGQGETVLIPWVIGSHYEKLSYHGHAMLVKSVLCDILGVKQNWKANVPPGVEIAAHRQSGTEWDLLHAVNITGQLGTAYHEPIRLHNLDFTFKPEREVREIVSLVNRQELQWEKRDDGRIGFTLPALELMETIIVKY